MNLELSADLTFARTFLRSLEPKIRNKPGHGICRLYDANPYRACYDLARPGMVNKGIVDGTAKSPRSEQYRDYLRRLNTL
jgi:hypothetical protein